MPITVIAPYSFKKTIIKALIHGGTVAGISILTAFITHPADINLGTFHLPLAIGVALAAGLLNWLKNRDK